MLLAAFGFLRYWEEAEEAGVNTREMLRSRMVDEKHRLEQLLRTGEEGLLAEEIAQVGSLPEIDVVALVDDQERVLAANQLLTVGRSMLDALREFDPARLRLAQRDRRLTIDHDAAHANLLAYQAITLAPAPGRIGAGAQGGLMVKYDLASSRARARRQGLTSTLRVMPLALVVLGVVMLMLRRFVSQPLEYLEAAVSRCSRGDFSTRVEIPGSGEMAEIGAGIDRMQADLARLSAERERNMAVAAARPDEARPEPALVSSPMAVAGLDGRILRVNRAFCEMLGRTEPELLTTTLQGMTRPEDLVADGSLVQEIIEGKRHSFQREKRYLGPLGQAVPAQVDVSLVTNASGAPQFLLVQTQDIGGRKRAEEALQSSLREKEGLLKEVHHRVKNNLQVINSLLRLESGRNPDPGTKSVLKDMQGRIRSMALLHETLYRSGTFASVDLGAYLGQLATQSFRALNTQPGLVQLRLDVTSVRVAVDQVIPCGLLVNELISNSLKHGFPSGDGGGIRVELQPTDGGRRLLLRVSDDGRGLPADFESRRGQSLGLQLVADLARQIGGQLEIGPGPGSGAVFTVTWAVDERMASTADPVEPPAPRR